MRSLCLLLVVGCSSNGLPTTGSTGGTTGGGTTGGGTTGGPQPTSCGGKTGSDCDPDEYCEFPGESPCGNFDVPGTCKKRPQACTDIASPVCGCDGNSYGNLCSAHGAGTDVYYSGECKQVPPDPPTACGAELGVTCGNDEYCYFMPGGMCDWADGTGTCVKRPDICNDLYAPVCGCDGQTYGNECEAGAAGWGVAYQGECGMPTTDCQTTGCPQGQSCQLCWASYQCLPPNVAC